MVKNEIAYQLKKANIGMFVLRDIKVKHEDLTAQIDYVIITPVYTYYVECKNLVGNITVNDKGDFIREFVVNGKKIIVGRFKDRDTAEEIVTACINHNWQLNEIKGLIDLKKIKPKNYTCINGCWVIQKSVNGKNVVFNSFSTKTVDEETVLDIVDFYRSIDWNLSYRDEVYELFNIS